MKKCTVHSICGRGPRLLWGGGLVQSHARVSFSVLVPYPTRSKCREACGYPVPAPGTRTNLSLRAGYPLIFFELEFELVKSVQ